MLRRPAANRRLLRKRMYKSPHSRYRHNEYFRENKNLVKTHQKEFKESHAPIAKRKRRPKREVEGYKMSYRYKYYLENVVEDDEEELD